MTFLVAKRIASPPDFCSHEVAVFSSSPSGVSARWCKQSLCGRDELLWVLSPMNRVRAEWLGVHINIFIVCIKAGMISLPRRREEMHVHMYMFNLTWKEQVNMLNGNHKRC